MEENLKLYHGSQQIVEMPKFGMGKSYNDYGQGFYCTENIELAKEWACPVKNDGYANKYMLQLSGLNVMHLTAGRFNILNWISILLKNRRFDIDSPVGRAAKEYLLTHFLPDTRDVDVMIGYRADDSYFSFAEDFVNNMISLRDLSTAMQLGALGEQVVLISEKAFSQISFLGYEVSEHSEYYYKRTERDQKARNAYKEHRKNLQQLGKDIFMLDIIRKEMKQDDPRLQSAIHS